MGGEVLLFVAVGVEFDDAAPGLFGPGDVVVLDAVVEGDAIGEAIARKGGEPAMLPVEVAIEPEAGDREGIGSL